MTATIATNLLDRVSSTENLPSLPTVAIEVLRLTKDPNSSADDLAKAIQHDPALTGKMLRVVNSAMFGMSREVGTIKHAVALLGVRTVKIMALSFSLVETMRQAEGAEFDFEAYWRRSLTTAVAARLLGKAAGSRQAEEAFVCGLLSGIGMIAAWRGAPDIYGPVLAQVADGRNLAEVEMETFGFTFATMSARLLKDWGLPEIICSAVGAANGEHLDDLKGEPRKLADIVHAAATVSSLFCGDIPQGEVACVRGYCQELLRLSTEDVDASLSELHKHVQQTASLLSVSVGKTTDYAMLQAQAAQQLAQISMQTEVERASIARKEESTRRENEKLAKEKHAMAHKAATDALTGIANRAAFDEHVSQQIESTLTHHKPLALIILDVDHFKKFNDTHGHQAGDAVLKEVAQTLAKSCGKQAFAARYGGEEFVAVASGADSSAARKLAEKIRAAIEKHSVRFEGKPLRVTASFGVAIWDNAETAANWIHRADTALYQAKSAGRNQVATA